MIDVEAMIKLETHRYDRSLKDVLSERTGTHSSFAGKIDFEKPQPTTTGYHHHANTILVVSARNASKSILINLGGTVIDSHTNQSFILKDLAHKILFDDNVANLHPARRSPCRNEWIRLLPYSDTYT